MFDVILTLTATEWEAACAIGRKRQALREARGRSPAQYRDKGGTHDDRNMIGAVAEYALARYYGDATLRDWCEHKSFSLNHHTIPCDVGTNLHVRATANPKARLLVAHPYDPDDGVFVLGYVDGDARRVTFTGWAYGGAIKQPENWRSTGPGFAWRPAYGLDRDQLNPMDTVPPEATHAPPRTLTDAGAEPVLAGLGGSGDRDGGADALGRSADDQADLGGRD